MTWLFTLALAPLTVETVRVSPSGSLSAVVGLALSRFLPVSFMFSSVENASSTAVGRRFSSRKSTSPPGDWVSGSADGLLMVPLGSL